MAEFTDRKQEARAKALEADMAAADNMSGRALARASGVDDKQIRNARGRHQVPQDETWARLAAALPGGRLSALLEKQGIEVPAAPAGATSRAQSATERPTGNGIVSIPFGLLRPNPNNYRKTFGEEDIEQLAESIAAEGLLQNLVVLPAGADGIHTINSGGRRYAALNLLFNARRIDADYPVACLVKDLQQDEARALALIENLQRQEVPVLEEAEGFKALTALGWDTEKIAAACHIAQRTVQDRLQLFDRLKPVARAALAEGTITLDQARAIVSTPIEKEQNELVTLALRNGYSAASLRDRAKAGKVRASKAAFDLRLYKGEFIGSGADRVFADTDAFQKLQRKAAQKKAEAIEAEGRFANVTLLGIGEDFDYGRYRMVDEEDVTSENEAKIEVFVSVDRWRHEIEIEYGEPRADGDDAEVFWDEDDEAGETAERERQERHERARAFLRRMIEAAQDNPHRLLKHLILFGLAHDVSTAEMPRLMPDHLTESWVLNLPATAEKLAEITGEGWTFIGDDGAAITVAAEGKLEDLPRNEDVGNLAPADAARLAAWLDGATDRDILALHAALECSRIQMFHSLTLGPADMALSADLGVEVPDFMRPAAEETDDAGEAEDASEEAAA